MLARMAKWEDLDQSVCLGFFDKQLVFKILENLPYSKTCVKRPLKNRQNKGLKDN